MDQFQSWLNVIKLLWRVHTADADETRQFCLVSIQFRWVLSRLNLVSNLQLLTSLTLPPGPARPVIYWVRSAPACSYTNSRFSPARPIMACLHRRRGRDKTVLFCLQSCSDRQLGKTRQESFVASPMCSHRQHGLIETGSRPHKTVLSCRVGGVNTLTQLQTWQGSFVSFASAVWTGHYFSSYAYSSCP